MAKHVQSRDYDAVIDELFLQKNSAIDKYRNVRRTLYEMNINRDYRRPFSCMPAEARRCFMNSFYNHAKGTTKKEKMAEAMERLNHAVGKDPGNDKSCHTRCLKLLKELNVYMKGEGLNEITDFEFFLNWLTYDYNVYKDVYGFYEQDPDYGFTKRWWNDLNLIEFKQKLHDDREKGIHRSMQEIYQEILDDRDRKYLD